MVYQSLLACLVGGEMSSSCFLLTVMSSKQVVTPVNHSGVKKELQAASLQIAGPTKRGKSGGISWFTVDEAVTQ